MIKLKVRIKAENKGYSQEETLEDNFNVSKTNPKLEALVQKIVDDSKLQNIEDVIVTAKFEW